MATDLGLDRIVRLAARALEVSVAVVVALDAGGRWIRAAHGITGQAIPASLDLQSSAIAGQSPLVLLDAAGDSRYARHPLVAGEPHIRFYAAVPLTDDKSLGFGALYLFDRKPRKAWTAADEAVIGDFGDLLVERFMAAAERSAEASAGAANETRPPAVTSSAISSDDSSLRLDIIAKLAHELRSPLNAMLGFIEIMQRQLHGPLGHPTYVEYADLLYRSGQHLATLTGDTLDLAQIGMGKVRPDDDLIDIHVTARDALAMYEIEAEEAGLTMRQRLPESLPGLRADRQHVTQMLSNLISNGIKYTPSGGTVELRAGLAPDGSLLLEVADSGIGIDPDQVATVLEPFGRIDNPTTRSREGAGLGLSLVKQLIELHGGTISIEGGCGRGTTVALRFPKERIQDQAPALTDPPIRHMSPSLFRDRSAA